VTRLLSRVFDNAISRVGWGLADQGLSSITNFVLGIVVARSLPPSEFGAFSIAFGVYTIGLGIVRAVTSEPLMVRFSGASAVEWREGARAATGTAIWVGMLAGVASLGFGLISHGALASALTAMGLTLPGLLLQDTWRFAFFSARRGSTAFANDFVWGAILASWLTVSLLSGRTSLFWIVLAWGGSGSIASLVGVYQAGLIPAPSRAPTWFRTQRDLIPRYTGEFGASVLITQLAFFGVGALAGLAEVGGIRAGWLLLGPLNVIRLGISLAGLPQAVRLLRVSPAKLKRTCAWWSAELAVCALGVGVLASLLPDRFGIVLLGENWPRAEEVLLPLSISAAGSGIIMGAGIGLRALAAAKLSLRARLLNAPLVLGGALSGATFWGARGAAWGFAVAYWIGSFIWWRFFMEGLRRFRASGSAGIPGALMEPDISEGGFHA
jgi:O-antigen/teichoic acid export membrane protein